MSNRNSDISYYNILDSKLINSVNKIISNRADHFTQDELNKLCEKVMQIGNRLNFLNIEFGSELKKTKYFELEVVQDKISYYLEIIGKNKKKSPSSVKPSGLSLLLKSKKLKKEL